MIQLETSLVRLIYHGKSLTKVNSVDSLPIFVVRTTDDNYLHFFSVALKEMEMPRNRDAYVERVTITLASFLRTVELEVSKIFVFQSDLDDDERYESAAHRVIETMYDRIWGDLQPVMMNSTMIKGTPCYFILGGWIALIEPSLLENGCTGNQSLDNKIKHELPEGLGNSVLGIDFYVTIGGSIVTMTLIVRCLDISRGGELNLLPEHFADDDGYAMMHTLVDDLQESIIEMNPYLNPDSFKLTNKTH